MERNIEEFRNIVNIWEQIGSKLTYRKHTLISRKVMTRLQILLRQISLIKLALTRGERYESSE